MAEEAEDINRVAASRGYLDPWPPVRGEYLLGDPGARVAVVTLASTFHPRGGHIRPLQDREPGIGEDCGQCDQQQ